MLILILKKESLQRQIVQRSLLFSRIPKLGISILILRISRKFRRANSRLKFSRHLARYRSRGSRAREKVGKKSGRGLAEGNRLNFQQSHFALVCRAHLHLHVSPAIRPAPFNNSVTSVHARPFKFATFAFTFASETALPRSPETLWKIHISRYLDLPRAVPELRNILIGSLSLSLSLTPCGESARATWKNRSLYGGFSAGPRDFSRETRKPQLSGSLDLAWRARGGRIPRRRRRRRRRSRDKRRAIYLSSLRFTRESRWPPRKNLVDGWTAREFVR